MTLEELKNNREIEEYYKRGDAILGTLGYTDHSTAHALVVAKNAGNILEWYHYTKHDIELVRIAAYLHDIGNCINRHHHAEYGALLANDILRSTDLSVKDRTDIVASIANHDESTGIAFDPISAALIIADKSDVRRNRVRVKPKSQFDIHDRVNYAVTGSNLKYEEEKNRLALNLQIDESICTMYDYFEIFLDRMMMCRRAAEVLNSSFKLTVNGHKVL